MPDISLLEPDVLRDVVYKLPLPANLIMLNSIPKSPNPWPVATWEVIRGSRTMARPNVPNSEAHIVPRIGISQQSSTMVYLREKKVFQPTTLHWLKAPGSLTATRNAEQEVLKEVADLNLRFDNFWEWSLWQAVQGGLVIDSPDVQANVDYMLPSSHKVTPATLWTDANVTPQNIVDNITIWKRQILRDGLVNATNCYATSVTLNLIVQAFTRNGISLMSDRMRDEFFSSGTLRGFMGMNWIGVDSQYDIRNLDGTYTTVGFLPDNVLIIGDLATNGPIQLLQGPTADDEAPDGFIGRFAKSWKEKDPSARQFLIEEHALPIVTRPEQWMVATVG